MSSSVSTAADASARLLDVRAVAKKLNCSTRHVDRLCDAGKMPRPLKLGSLVRWSAKAIAEWVDRGCPPCRKGTGR